jgi:hydroxyacylglutathione hydrolase
MQIIVDNNDLKIKKMELGRFATNAYVVICPKTSKSALIDVPDGVPTILENLEGTNIEFILLTHNHLDHIEGLSAITGKVQAALAVHPADSPMWLPSAPDISLSDNDIINVGDIKIECLYTPGHTPGSMVFKIGEYLLSGDTIFPGGPGRTPGPSQFKQIVKSITEKVFVLPDSTQVFPGHGGPTVLKREKEEFAFFSSKIHDPELSGDVTWLNS